MRILLTNDDGIHAPGLGWLYRAVADLGQVHVVAPADVQSATSHGITLHKPIHTRRVHVDLPGQPAAHFHGVAVEGRPADCVKLAVAHLLDGPVNLVLSGINAGANVGVNLLYSGTVAAAREGAILGLPAVALSLHLGDRTKTDWLRASRHVAAVLAKILARPLEKGTLLNVNIPILDAGVEPRGIRVVPADVIPLADRYRKSDVPGGAAYECEGSMTFRGVTQGGDVEALFQKFITITPMHFNTNHTDAAGLWGDRLGGQAWK